MEGGGIGGNVIPIAGTNKSGIKFFKWAQRFCFVLATNGCTHGWAFARKDGSHLKASDYKKCHLLRTGENPRRVS